MRVAVRGRPLLDFEDRNRCVDVDGGSGAVQVGRNPSDDKHLLASACPRFVFDAGFGLDSTQEDLFEWVLPAIDGCFEGYNAAIMAYGQTGSGKTYSMGTASAAGYQPPELYGLVPRAFDRIASEIQRRSEEAEAEFEIRISFVEVHDDNVNDLLSDPGTTGDVVIREDGRGEVVLVGATEVEAGSCDEMMRLLERGTLARTTAATRMNDVSSRSHAVLTLTLEQRLRAKSPARERGATERVRAKLQLVDLAGSERNKRTGTTGKHFKESVNINQGLLALANCINVLSDEHARPGMHVPYRDHKLTRLLRNSLGGNARTYMLACVSVSAANFQETLNTLRYAARARNIKNTPVINRGEDDDQLAKMEREMAELKSELAAATADPSGMVEELRAMRDKNELLEERVAQLTESLRRQPGIDAMVSVPASELDDCEDVAVLRKALRAKEVQLAKAEDGLKKDEEMIGTLGVQLQELAWTNSKLQEELAACRSGQDSSIRPATPSKLETTGFSDDDTVRIGDDEEDVEVTEVDVPAKSDLAQEQERWMSGQRRIKKIEIDGREAESEFKVHHQMMQKRVRELETQIREKAQLIKDLERDKESQESLQQQYASVLAELRYEVEEKERRLGGIKKQRGRTEEEQLTIAQQYSLVSTELELLRRRVKEQEGAMKRVKSSAKKIDALQEELRKMKSERGSVSQKIKMDIGAHKERARAAGEEIKRLKAQSDASYRMVRQLKAQVREQAASMAKKQSELDAARKHAARPPSRGHSSTPVRGGTPAPVISKAEVGRLMKRLLKEVDSEIRKADYEKQLSSGLTKLKELKGERNKQAALAKAMEMRVHRGQALSEEEQRSYRELKDGVEDLNAEMEYLDGSISQVRKRVAKADGLVVRTSLEQINEVEAKGLVPELIATLKRAKEGEGAKAREVTRLEKDVRDVQATAAKQRQGAQLAEMDLKRRLDEQKREFEYKLLSAYQQMDSSVQHMHQMSTERAGSAGSERPPTDVEPDAPQEKRMMRIKDDQISILTEHNTLYKKRIKELTRKLKSMQQLVVKQEIADHADARPSDAFYSTQRDGAQPAADGDADPPMMNSAAAAQGIYASDAAEAGAPPEAGEVRGPAPPPPRDRPEPVAASAKAEPKPRDWDRERRRKEKSRREREGGRGGTPAPDLEPPAVMATDGAVEAPVHSLTAPERPSGLPPRTPPLEGEQSSGRLVDDGRERSPDRTFDDNTAVRAAQKELLRRGHEVVGQSQEADRRSSIEPGAVRKTSHRRRHSSPDRAPSGFANSRAAGGEEDATAIQESIDMHAERLRAEVTGESEQPLPRLGARNSARAGGAAPAGGESTGPFMTREEHERRKKERATRLAAMKKDAVSRRSFPT